MLRVKVIKDFRNGDHYYRIGQILEPPAMLRETLIKNRWVEIIDESPDAKQRDAAGAETATLRRAPPRPQPRTYRRKRGR